MINPSRELLNIESLGFEFETCNIVSVQKQNNDYIPQDYYYVIPIKVNGTNVTLTNDVIDDEIGKGEDKTLPLYKNGNIIGNIKRPKNAEHAELHITFPKIVASENCINEYLKKSASVFTKLFDNKHGETLELQVSEGKKKFIGIVHIENDKEDHIEVYNKKECALLMKNNIAFKDAVWVPQMTFGIKLSNVIETIEFLSRNTSYHEILVDEINKNKNLLDSIDSYYKELHSWLVLASLILRAEDENHHSEKTRVHFVPRHYFWEFFPFSGDTKLFEWSKNKTSSIARLINTTFLFSNRKPLVYQSKLHQLIQNFNPVHEDIIEYNDFDLNNIKEEIERTSNILSSKIHINNTKKYGIKKLFIDTKKYQLIEAGVNPTILIEYRGFLHHFPDSVISFNNS